LYIDSGNALSKYNTNTAKGVVDNLTTLELTDDAAYTSDNTCRMPTRADFEELVANTTSTWETLNDVNGIKFTSNANGNSIFVPAAGYYEDGSVYEIGSFSRLWSSSLREDNPMFSWELSFSIMDVVQVDYSWRHVGCTARPVQDPNTPTTINLKELKNKTDLIKNKTDLIKTDGDGTKLLSDNGEYKEIDIEQIKKEVINGGIIDTSKYQFVDLGLPSGNKWATCNVGSNNPEEAGLYFAWGELDGYTLEDVAAGKKRFYWTDYRFGNKDAMTKYNATDGLTQLELSDDASYQSDNGCRIPNKDELQELIDNTTINYDLLSKKCIKLISKINNNYIIIPIGGSGDGNFIGEYGYIWSSSLDITQNNYGHYVRINLNEGINVRETGRCNGFNIRPIQSANTPPVTINLKELQDKVDNIEIQAKDSKEVFIITPDMFEEASSTTGDSITFTQDAWYEFKEAVKSHKIIGINKEIFSLSSGAAPLSMGTPESYVISTYVSHTNYYSFLISFELTSFETTDIERYEMVITNRSCRFIKNILADGHFIIDETMLTASITDEPISSFELTDEYKNVLKRAISLNKVIGISNSLLHHLIQSIATTNNVNARGMLFTGFSIINLTETIDSTFVGHVYYGFIGILLKIICLDGVITVEKETMLLGSGDGTKFLADDGSYKEVNTQPFFDLGYLEFDSNSGVITDEEFINKYKDYISKNDLNLRCVFSFTKDHANYKVILHHEFYPVVYRAAYFTGIATADTEPGKTCNIHIEIGESNPITYTIIELANSVTVDLTDSSITEEKYNEMYAAINNNIPINVLIYNEVANNFIGLKQADATMDPGGNITLFYTVMSRDEGDLRYFRAGILSNDLSIIKEELFNSSKINSAIQPEDLVTTTTPGLMSAEDKAKLDQVTAANTSIVTQAEYDALVSAGVVTSGTVYYIRG
jgi:hypothetical protein